MLEVVSDAGGYGLEDLDLQMNGSSDLDEVMEIFGGTEAVEFIREVNEGVGSLA